VTVISSIYKRYWDRKVLPLLHSRGDTFSLSETPYYVYILIWPGHFLFGGFTISFRSEKILWSPLTREFFITIYYWFISVISCFWTSSVTWVFVFPPPSPTTSMECFTPAFRVHHRESLSGGSFYDDERWIVFILSVACLRAYVAWQLMLSCVRCFIAGQRWWLIIATLRSLLLSSKE